MKQIMGILTGLALVAGVIALAALVAPGGAWAQDGDPTPVPDPVLGELDLDAVAEIDLEAVPVIPEIDEGALALYGAALDAGRDPHAFAKVGDCMTDHPSFLIPIGEGEYDLGEYADLETVIAAFQAGELDPFARQSQAAAGGFNAASILDSMWANPEFCESGETPLSCEFRLSQPSVALIMFGTNDVFYLDEAQYDFSLRSIIAETIRSNVLPIVSTFPVRPEFPEKSVLYNQIVVQAAADYGVPLINLWRALEPLPNQGIDPEETTHMTVPPDGAACVFIDENLQAGFTVRNLVTLQALDALLGAAGGE